MAEKVKIGFIGGGKRRIRRECFVESGLMSKHFRQATDNSPPQIRRLDYGSKKLTKKKTYLSGFKDLNACLIVLLPGRRFKKSARMLDNNIVSSIAGSVVVMRASSVVWCGVECVCVV